MDKRPICENCKYYRNLELLYGETLETHACVIEEYDNDYVLLNGWVYEVKPTDRCDRYKEKIGE